MHIGLGTRLLVSAAILAAAISFTFTTVIPRGFPLLDVQPIDSDTVVFHAAKGVPMPSGLADGDRLNLSKQDFTARIAVVLPTLPIGYTVRFTVERGNASVVVPLAVMALQHSYPAGRTIVGWPQWVSLAADILLAGVAMLLLWRGRNRAASGMALWAIAYVLSVGANSAPLAGWIGITVFYFGIVCFLTARVGFYLMIAAILKPILSPNHNRLFGFGFAAVLACGAVQSAGSQIFRMLTGSVQFVQPSYGLILTASYLVPVVMLILGYQRAGIAERPRLRWMLTGGMAWACFILLQNTPFLGPTVSYIAGVVLQVMALFTFLYAVLRLRMVDISVVIDQALVYGLVTTLVVGVIAAVNSLALRETVTPGAGLALQIVVPLALGIVLGRVRTYADLVVERVFFREKYRAEIALRAFANHAGYMENVHNLLVAAGKACLRHAGVPGVAIYSAEVTVFRRVLQDGETDFPFELSADDPALVAVRAERRAIDLADFTSALGTDCCVIPMLVLGTVQGVMVCSNRPGEHFPASEKALIGDVANAVGAAWRILRANDNEVFVRAVASGALSPDVAQKQAQALLVT